MRKQQSIKGIVFGIFITLTFPMIVFLSLSKCNKPVRKYTGTIININEYSASLKTKTNSGVDTIIIVRLGKNETYGIGETVTIWTGGTLVGDFGITEQIK
mgnify:CR=1 FL=1